MVKWKGVWQVLKKPAMLIELLQQSCRFGYYTYQLEVKRADK